MGRPSVDSPSSPSGTLRTVRPDGTPIYAYAERAGVPPVSVVPMTAHTTADLFAHGHGHAHDFHVLIYVERGSGSVEIGDRAVDLDDGALFAVPPGQVVSAGTVHNLTGGRAWSVAFIPSASPALAGISPLAWGHHPLLALFAGDGRGATVPEADRPRWHSWLADLTEETADPTRPGAHEAITALLTRLLVASSRLAPEAPAAPDPLVTRVFDRIEAVYSTPATATDVAEALGYTPGHLTTAMRRRTGRTLLDWLTERRLTEARRLLRETDLPLGVIAVRTGFGDAGYLVRRFRTRYGITPGRWRAAQKQA